jgi:hypothetical protein
MSMAATNSTKRSAVTLLVALGLITATITVLVFGYPKEKYVAYTPTIDLRVPVPSTTGQR